MPNRTLLIAGNWKMNNDVAEAAKLADELAQALPEVPAGRMEGARGLPSDHRHHHGS